MRKTSLHPFRKRAVFFLSQGKYSVIGKRTGQYKICMKTEISTKQTKTVRTKGLCKLRVKWITKHQLLVNEQILTQNKGWKLDHWTNFD